MKIFSNTPMWLRMMATALLIAVAAGVVALMRGNPAHGDELPAKVAQTEDKTSDPAQAQAQATDAASGTAAAQARPPAAAQGPAVATLGAVRVDRDELAHQLEALTPQARALLKKGNRAGLDQWLRARLAEKALVEQARAAGWQERPELLRAFQAAQERIVLQTYLDSVSRAPDDYPAEADLQAAYERAKPQLTEPALYRVSQIFLPAALGDSDAVAAARKQA